MSEIDHGRRRTIAMPKAGSERAAGSDLQERRLAQRLHKPIPHRERGADLMTKASRVAAIGVLVLLPGATLSAQERPPIAEGIAKTYGLDSFGEIEEIHFTFTVDSKDLKLSQTWDWEPKKDEVSYDVKDEVDPAFQNAQYWLLFPLHLSWDGSAKVEDTGTHKLPLGKGSATRVVVTYPSQGGYTPGDIWELFVGTDGRVRQFIWRLGGSAEPTVVASWDGYKKAGPLLLSLEHRGTLNGKPLRVFFSNVSVKLSGSNTWVNAQ